MIFSPMTSCREDEENLSSSFLLIDKKQMREFRLKKKQLLILLVAASPCIAVVLCNSSGFRRPISIAATPITATSDVVPHAYNSNTKNDVDIGDDNNKGSVIIATSTTSDSTAIFKECRPDDLGVSGCGAGEQCTKIFTKTTDNNNDDDGHSALRQHPSISKNKTTNDFDDDEESETWYCQSDSSVSTSLSSPSPVNFYEVSDSIDGFIIGKRNHAESNWLLRDTLHR